MHLFCSHSSSSAIFERDIEPIGLASPTSPSNPHRTSRAKNTESLEQGVPAVLDSALSMLAETDVSDQISVEAPITGSVSGLTSPIGSYRSRSPSPTAHLGLTSPGGFGRNSLLLSIPGPSSPQSPGHGYAGTPIPGAQVSPSLSGGLTARPPALGTETATPTSAYYSTASAASTAGSPPDSPTSTTRLPTASPPFTSHPPSPTTKASKRLSFMSYNDLLSSTPAGTVPLAVLTTDASIMEPPPHISALAPFPGSGSTMSPGSGVASAATSLRGRDRNSVVLSPSLSLMDDAGGEWERQGLGRGLEERLEMDSIRV